MTVRSPLILLALCLAPLGGCTNDPRPQTPLPGTPRMACSLVPCVLPARPAVLVNDQWRQALDTTDAALSSCALQVMGCIERQEAQAP